MVTDADMGVGFPERDFDGYALFGAIEGIAPYRAIKLILFPIGTLRPTLRSPGVGYWEWDGFQVGDEHGLFAWHAVDGLGSTVVSEAVTTYPDGERHVGPLTL